jgi:hypothetical protein
VSTPCRLTIEASVTRNELFQSQSEEENGIYNGRDEKQQLNTERADDDLLVRLPPDALYIIVE